MNVSFKQRKPCWSATELSGRWNCSNSSDFFSLATSNSGEKATRTTRRWNHTFNAAQEARLHL